MKETYIKRGYMKSLPPEDVKKFQAFLDCGFKIAFPYNHDPDIVEKVEAYFPYIGEFFAPLHPSIFPSLRVWDNDLDADKYLDILCEMAEKLARHGIYINIIMNMSNAINVDRPPLFRHIAAVAEAGLVRLTVPDIYWGEVLHNQFPQLELGPSVAANVHSQATALIWKQWAGASFLVLGYEVNKDLQRIATIRKLGMAIKVVAYDSCIPECPLQTRHIAILGNQNKNWRDEPETLDASLPCLHLRHNLPVWHWVKKEILPFSLPRYAGLIDTIKIIDRRERTDANIRTLRNYLEMKDDVHPTIGYREHPDAIDKITHCLKNCWECNWCAENNPPAEPRRDTVRADLGEISHAEGTKTQMAITRRPVNFDSSDAERIDQSRAAVATVQEEKPASVMETSPEPQAERDAPPVVEEEKKTISKSPVIDCPANLRGRDSLVWWSKRLEGDIDNSDLADVLKDLMALFGGWIKSPSNGSGLAFMRIFQPYPDGLAISFGKDKDELVLFLGAEPSQPVKKYSYGESQLSMLSGAIPPEDELEQIDNYIRDVLGT